MRTTRRRSAAKTGMRGTRSSRSAWRCAAKPGVAATESCASHHFGEALAAEPQSQHDDRRRQAEQQEAEGGALFPIEARDELRVDLLGEPLRVLAAEQRRSQVIAEREHEYDDAAGGDAGRRMRNHDRSQHGKAV